MELVAQGRWIELMRTEMENLRSPDDVRRLPFCTVYVLFADLEKHYLYAQNADRALIGLPPMKIHDE